MAFLDSTFIIRKLVPPLNTASYLLSRMILANTMIIMTTAIISTNCPNPIFNKFIDSV